MQQLAKIDRKLRLKTVEVVTESDSSDLPFYKLKRDSEFSNAPHIKLHKMMSRDMLVNEKNDTFHKMAAKHSDKLR